VDLGDDQKRNAGELEDDDALSDVTESCHLHRDITDDVRRLRRNQHRSAAATRAVPAHQQLELQRSS